MSSLPGYLRDRAPTEYTVANTPDGDIESSEYEFSQEHNVAIYIASAAGYTRVRLAETGAETINYNLIDGPIIVNVADWRCCGCPILRMPPRSIWTDVHGDVIELAKKLCVKSNFMMDWQSMKAFIDLSGAGNTVYAGPPHITEEAKKYVLSTTKYEDSAWIVSLKVPSRSVVDVQVD